RSNGELDQSTAAVCRSVLANLVAVLRPRHALCRNQTGKIAFEPGRRQELEGLRNHPSADSWTPGGAGLVLHTILFDPADAKKFWVGISSAGVFATEDGGATWDRR